MGKKSWFSAVRKVISTSYLKEKKLHKTSHNKSKSTKKSYHGNQMSLDKSLSPTKATLLPIPKHEPMQQDSVAIAEVNCVISAPAFPVKSREDMAAIKIQKAYRGYLVRNDSNPLKAWRRLKIYMQSQAVKRQSAATLTSIQTMTRVQSQVRTRKIRMAEVNEALQQQLHQKRLNKLNTTKSSERSGWDLSPKSKEQVEQSLRRKKEAAERREKVLAYSYTKQQTWRKNLQKSASSNSADWEWNWSENWHVVRPWETRTNRDTVGVMTKRQSPPSKVAAQPQSKVAKSAKTWCPISKSGPSPSPLVSGKKRVQNAGSVVGSAKKRLVVSGSPSSSGKKSLGSSRINTNTKR